MKVLFANKISQEMANYPNADLQKIKDFVEEVEKNGLTNLQGRNKSSDGFSDDDPNFADKIAYVRQHNLWHYHIGIPNYEQSSKGDMVSEFVLHYMRYDDHIKIVDMSDHPPFTLPTKDYLT